MYLFKRLNSSWILLSSILVFSFAFLAGCENPVITQLQEKIAKDVDAYVTGSDKTTNANQSNTNTPAPAAPGPTVEVPRITSIAPASDLTNVPSSATVSIVFSMEMNASTISASTLRLLRMPSQTAVNGTVSYDAATKTAVFTPSARLDVDTAYRVIVGTGAKSLLNSTFAFDYASTFTTRFFHDDEIGIELQYSSADMVLDSTHPIYFQIYPVPLEKKNPLAMAILTSIPVTASGKYRIPKSLIPESADKALIFMFHDIDNNYTLGDDGASEGDSERIVKLGVPGNSIDMNAGGPEVLLRDANNVLVVTDGFYTVNEAYAVPVGSGYAVTYADGSPVVADGFESLDSLLAFRALAQGVYETARNLHSLTDVDYLRFTPPTTDHYIVQTKATNFDLRVGLYSSDSNALTKANALAESTGKLERVVNTNAYQLTGGMTYYLRVESPSAGIGSYEVSYSLRPVPADAFEPNDDPNSPTPLAFGRANKKTAILGGSENGQDPDVFAITVEADKRYAIEVTETDNYFGPGLAKRNLQFSVTMYTQWDGTTGAGIWQTDIENFYQIANGKVMFSASRVNVVSGSATRWLVINNVTPAQGSGGPVPSGQYEVLYTYGPDSGDKEFDGAAAQSDDVVTSAVATQLDYSRLYPSKSASLRSIYSGTNAADPGADIDWFRIQVRNNMTDYLLKTEPEPGADGVAADFDVYLPQTGNVNLPDLASGIAASGQLWSAEAGEPIRGLQFKAYQLHGSAPAYTTYYPNTAQSTFYIKVRRSTQAGNPATGQYRLTFTAGADNEDDQNPDTSTTVSSVAYGIDETPWIGQPVSTDFWDRNKLAEKTDWLNGSTLLRYNTIHRRTYDLGTGKPNGASLGADVDFLWAEIPAGLTSVYLNIIASLEAAPNTPGMPIKATVYKAPNASKPTARETIAARDANSDKVVITDELEPVGIYTSESYYLEHLPNGDHQVFQSISVTGGDVLFIKVERNTGSTTGNLENGEYFIRLLQL